MGRTPLGVAAQCGHLDVIQFLVENCKATIDAQDEFNETPLTLASRNNHPQSVTYLLSQGANLSIKGWQWKTALEWAIEKNNNDVIKIFQNITKK